MLNNMITLLFLSYIAGIITAISTAIKSENFDVKCHKRRVIMTYLTVSLLIVVAFIICADDFVEKLLIFILCGIVVPSAIGLLTKDCEKFEAPMSISIIIHSIIFFAMFACIQTTNGYESITKKKKLL